MTVSRRTLLIVVYYFHPFSGHQVKWPWSWNGSNQWRMESAVWDKPLWPCVKSKSIHWPPLPWSQSHWEGRNKVITLISGVRARDACMTGVAVSRPPLYTVRLTPPPPPDIADSNHSLAFKFLRNKMVLPYSLVKIQYCGEPPWPRSSELSLRPPGFDFESCVWGQCNLTFLRRFSWPSLADMYTKVA